MNVTRHRLADGRALLLFGEHAPVHGVLGGPARDHSPPEVRHDELRDEHVVYAAGRQDRTYLPAPDACPLCPSRDGRDTEILTAAFEIAVFENRFPSLRAPLGEAEVVVYTDDHHRSYARLAPARARALMDVWHHRYEELGARGDVEYVMAFENRGTEVGTTLPHPHGQIYAYPFIPPVAALELAADARLGRCAICELLRREDGAERVVAQAGSVIAHVPYAARWPYEVRIAMRGHRASVLECTSDELADLAAVLQSVTKGYDALFERTFPYVMVVHQAPTAGRRDGHLHVELYPPLRTAEKLKYLAGSELGAGTFLVDVLPESSAAALRRAIARAA